jgi:UDP-glucuronate 4-epimerase
MSILVTGAAGFIGMHVCKNLLECGEEVIGIDCLNDYYPIALKQARLDILEKHNNFTFKKIDVSDNNELQASLDKYKINKVVHLAAQAGVRYSISNPHAYGESNLVGFLNILEASRRWGVEHLVYASSSSVYGGNRTMPYSEHVSVDHPISLYAATKKAAELMAHSYSHLYGLPTTGLRLFTVYGPWGRPDMSPLLFARAIFEGRSLDVFNNGDMKRDFTYIDDITEGVLRILDKPATSNPMYDPFQPDAGTSTAPWRIFNIGNSQSIRLLDYISTMERLIGKPAIKNFKPLQPGDVLETYADMSALNEWIGFNKSTPIEDGLEKLVLWVKQYYKY